MRQSTITQPPPHLNLILYFAWSHQKWFIATTYTLHDSGNLPTVAGGSWDATQCWLSSCAYRLLHLLQYKICQYPYEVVPVLDIKLITFVLIACVGTVRMVYRIVSLPFQWGGSQLGMYQNRLPHSLHSRKRKLSMVSVSWKLHVGGAAWVKLRAINN